LSVVACCDYLDLSVAKDLFQGQRPYARPTGYLCAGFPVGGCGKLGVQEDRDKGNRCRSCLRRSVQRVLSNRHQGIGVQLGAGALFPVGEGGVLVGSLLKRLFDESAICPGEQTPQLVRGLVQSRLDGQEPIAKHLLFVGAADPLMAGDLAA
jgi:hypothetical protein